MIKRSRCRTLLTDAAYISMCWSETLRAIAFPTEALLIGALLQRGCAAEKLISAAKVHTADLLGQVLVAVENEGRVATKEECWVGAAVTSGIAACRQRQRQFVEKGCDVTWCDTADLVVGIATVAECAGARRLMYCGIELGRLREISASAADVHRIRAPAGRVYSSWIQRILGSPPSRRASEIWAISG